MNQLEKYLRPTPVIDCDNKAIKEKAQALTHRQKEITDRAKSLFYFVRDEIKYNLYVVCDHPEHYQASKTLETREGFCVQKAVLLAALARAIEIPSRLHIAGIRNYLAPSKLRELMGTDLFSAHGYTELCIEDKWIKTTPAFDIKMCQKNRIIPVEFDGINNAMFHSHNLDGKKHIEYVYDHGHYDDLPFEKIINLRIQACGPGFFERLRQTIETRNVPLQ